MFSGFGFRNLVSLFKPSETGIHILYFLPGLFKVIVSVQDPVNKKSTFGIKLIMISPLMLKGLGPLS